MSADAGGVCVEAGAGRAARKAAPRWAAGRGVAPLRGGNWTGGGAVWGAGSAGGSPAGAGGACFFAVF
ncbi:MAG: hypothetical protein ACR2F8_10850, partial [Caulobacteraceae bacterium]